jgi:hypothetical protein
LILQLYSEPLAKELDLPLIGVNVVASIPYQVVKLLGIVIDCAVPLP